MPPSTGGFAPVPWAGAGTLVWDVLSAHPILLTHSCFPRPPALPAPEVLPALLSMAPALDLLSPSPCPSIPQSSRAGIQEGHPEVTVERGRMVGFVLVSETSAF